MNAATAARRVISASRRTDIPAFYAGWFCERLRAGEVLVPNPFNPRQVSRVALDPASVDCFVFWSKDPSPLMARLSELEDYTYYFQFTLNAYGPAIEPGIPEADGLIETFRRLADRVGPQRVIWRYDPIVLGPGLTAAWHQEHFATLAAGLAASTDLCTLSFVDDYARSARGLRAAGLTAPDETEMRTIAAGLAEVAAGYKLPLATCVETIDLAAWGIAHASCVDARRIERLTGRPVRAVKDPGQRAACGCAASIDIGSYNTCLAGCRYCYANFSSAKASSPGMVPVTDHNGV